MRRPPGSTPLGIARHRSVAELRATTGVSSTGRTVPCVGNGTSGNRVQAVYAHLSTKPDHFNQVLPLIRTWAAQANEAYNASAAETNGSRQIRFVMQNCLLSVLDKSVPASSASNFSAEITALQKAGLKATNRKYLIWTDANSYCGLGEVFPDTSPGPSNRNNTGPQYASVENGCWGQLGNPRSIGPSSVEAHELTHALGAVQANAPHKTSAGHCTDEWEAMCYHDASATHLRFTCPVQHSAFLDCGHNDYFSTSAPTGYLATHWNAAKNSFLVANIAPGNDKFANATPIDLTAGIYIGSNRLAHSETGEPATAGSPAARSIWYSVTPPTSERLTVDTKGSGFDTVLGIYSGTSVGSLTLVAGNDNAATGTTSQAFGDLTGGTTYFVKVDGKAGAVGPAILHAQFTPTGTTPAVITTVSPTQGPAGTTITITGSGFNVTPFFAVEVNGAPVSRFGAISSTSIQFQAPASVPDPGIFGNDPMNVGSRGPIAFIGFTGSTGPVTTYTLSDPTFKYTS
jgi:IPT/TIG domain